MRDFESGEKDEQSLVSKGLEVRVQESQQGAYDSWVASGTLKYQTLTLESAVEAQCLLTSLKLDIQGTLERAQSTQDTLELEGQS